ncbi:MAG: C-GCAxxG-C-C family (seleno)protein [Erysipelotrichales bacterium]
MNKQEIIDLSMNKMLNENYSCAQAIVFGMLKIIERYQPISTKKYIEYNQIASAFGGGIGGLRQTCGFIAGSGVAYSLIIEDNDLLRSKIAEVSALVEKMGGSWQCEKIIANYPDQSKPARKQECVKMLAVLLDSIDASIKDVFN